MVRRACSATIIVGASGWATFVAGRDLNSFVGVVRHAFVEYHLCFFRLFLPNCVTFINQSWHRIREIGTNLWCVIYLCSLHTSISWHVAEKLVMAPLSVSFIS